jgi:hypothetical protein
VGSGPAAGASRAACGPAWSRVPQSGVVRNFAAVTALISPDQVRAQFACGSDVRRQLEVAQPYVDAGFDRLVT